MKTSSLKEQQQRKIKSQPGFIAALDQSGGSTPKALRAYGIKEGAWSNEEEMFTLVHQMRARIMTSSNFNGDRILGAILFFYVWMRWTLPRYRYDQLMRFGWKVLLPLAVVNLLATAAAVLYFTTSS